MAAIFGFFGLAALVGVALYLNTEYGLWSAPRRLRSSTAETASPAVADLTAAPAGWLARERISGPPQFSLDGSLIIGSVWFAKWHLLNQLQPGSVKVCPK